MSAAPDVSDEGPLAGGAPDGPRACPAPERGWSPRFGRGLIGILACAALVHGWILAEAWSGNPLVSTPQGDATTYWAWAERIAAGEWIADEPFHVPPAYAYLLGLLRALGGGMLAVYVVQIGLHLATTALVGRIGHLVAGPAVGWIAAVLYASFEDAAFFLQRVSPPALQALLVAWTWWEWQRVAERPGTARSLRAGLALGLAVLANPVMLPSAAVLFAWLAWRAHRGALAWSRVGLACAATAAAIAPAPIHNWIAARELVPLTTQGGLAFAIGNQPGAVGTYHELEGVSVLRGDQDRDALALARAASGDPALGWNGADRYFYRRGLDYLLGEPAAAARLLGHKLRWYVGGRHYSDSYMPTLEVESGLASRLRFAWLRSAWLVPLALVAAWLARRAVCPILPGWVVLLAPLAAVLVYHYSSRYRVPALPPTAVFAAWGLVELVRSRAAARRSALAAGLLLGVGLGPINAATDFDSVDGYRADYEFLLGSTYYLRGDPLRASPHLQRAYELGATRAGATLAEMLHRSGRAEDARRIAEDALARDPGEPYVARVLAQICADAGDIARAKALFERALAALPDDVESELGLGSSCVALGAPAEGLRHYERALSLAPGREDLVYLRGIALEALGRNDAAEAAWTPLAELADQPGPDGALSEIRHAARNGLIRLWTSTGRYGLAIQRLRAVLAVRPGDGEAAIQLARLLAASPDASQRDPAASLRLAEALRQAAPDAPEVLEVWSLALAEHGRFDEALEAATRAAAAARALGGADFAAEMERRAALFRARIPFRLPAGR